MPDPTKPNIDAECAEQDASPPSSLVSDFLADEISALDSMRHDGTQQPFPEPEEDQTSPPTNTTPL